MRLLNLILLLLSELIGLLSVLQLLVKLFNLHGIHVWFVVWKWDSGMSLRLMSGFLRTTLWTLREILWWVLWMTKVGLWSTVTQLTASKWVSLSIKTTEHPCTWYSTKLPFYLLITPQNTIIIKLLVSIRVLHSNLLLLYPPYLSILQKPVKHSICFFLILV